MKRLRDLKKIRTENDGYRTLFESIVSNEVLETLTDWIENDKSNFVLIGGLALSYYVKPRATSDIDLLFLSVDDIPEKVYKFRKHRKGAFEHIKTNVEVEVVSPQTINTPLHVAQKVFDTSIETNGIKVASPSGIIALKLGRFSRQDQADIEALINYTTIDLNQFELSEVLIKRFEEIKK